MKMENNNENSWSGEFKQDPKSQTLEDYRIRKSNRKTKNTIKKEFEQNVVKMILENVEDGLKVEKFLGKGRGVVTTKFFKRGDFVCEYVGELLNLEEAKNREALYAQNFSIGCYMFYFKHLNRRFCIDATSETSRFCRLVNHSKHGNLNVKIICVNRLPRLIYFANKDIHIGEEVTYDYGDRSKKSLESNPWLAC